MREVNHRAQNMLGLVQSIARATAGPDSAAFLDSFGERIQALSANQRLLVRSECRGVEVGALIRSQLAHFGDLLDSRINLNGPSLILSVEASQTLGMALHELASRAVERERHPGFLPSLRRYEGVLAVNRRGPGDPSGPSWSPA